MGLFRQAPSVYLCVETLTLVVEAHVCLKRTFMNVNVMRGLPCRITNVLISMSVQIQTPAAGGSVSTMRGLTPVTVRQDTGRWMIPVETLMNVKRTILAHKLVPIHQDPTNAPV